MIYLIEYDRRQGRVVTLHEFDDSQRHESENARLDLELYLNREGIVHEVVLLQAANLDALKKTHQRYFSDLVDLLKNWSRQMPGLPQELQQ